MKDGTIHSIDAGVREFKLTDRALAQFRSTIQGVRIRPAPRLDRELGWLRSAVTVEEADANKPFAEMKMFIERLDTRSIEVTKRRKTT
ncbi:MAG: hypothetical protein WAK26_14350 [Terracidiphilus sp.]